MGEKVYLAQDAHVVKHNMAQNLTDAQKIQARANIGAMAAMNQAMAWAEVQEIVNHNQNAVFFPFGTQLFDDWTRGNGTKYNVPWDVAHNKDNEMTLRAHYCFPDEIVFDAPEALVRCPDGLAAGQYYVTIGRNYSTGWVAGKHINFTLTKAIPAGGQIYVDCDTNYANDPTAGRTVSTFESGNSTTPIETTTTTDSDVGTELGTTDTTSEHKTNGNINAEYRVVSGYGRWSQSWYRQWLNSDAAAGSVFVAQNDWDRPPAQAATLPGFMAGLTAEFKAILQKSTVVTALNTVEGFTDATEETEDYFFLPSLTEIYSIPQYAEGDEWDYFKALAEANNASGAGGKIPTGTALEWNRRFRLDAPTSAAIVRLRSAYRGSAHYAWVVNSSGYVGTNYAYYACRGCPACKIRKSA